MAILREFFLLLELRDRIQATAETYQKKLIQRFKTAKEEKKLRGASPRVVEMDLEKEQYLDAAKTIVQYFSEGDPTKNNKYLDWIVRQWIKGHLLWEDSGKMKRLLDDYETYRKKLEKKDINAYEDYHELEEALEPLRGTEVAGIRVQNFLKKDEVMKFRNNTVADPSHPDHKNDYTQIHDEENKDVPSWFEDSMRDSAQEMYDEREYEEQFYDDAYNELDEDDYTDEDGKVDEEQMESDARDAASEKSRDYADDYVDEYVRENSESEWREYVENNQEQFQSNLNTSQHQTPELDVVYENDRLSVMIPNSKEASCALGKGTEWCTASEESSNYWWEYAQDAPLYIIVTDKLGKFQFHFESQQYMDVHDRYIEDSNSLSSLVKKYPKELEEAFGKEAFANKEWWLLPVGDTPTEAWDGMLRQSTDHKEDVVRDVVRQWQAHRQQAPEGWADQVRQNILSGQQSEKAIKYGWVGKVEEHEADDLVKNGMENNTINPIQTAEYLASNDIAVDPDTWRSLILRTPATLFYAPLEILNRPLLDELMSQEVSTGQGKTSFLDDLYSRINHLKNKEKEINKPNAEGVVKQELNAAEKWTPEALQRGRQLARMITMDDIVASVIRYPHSLGKFKMDFGMKPWMAVAQDSMKKGAEQVQAFVYMASTVVRQNEDEPWIKDIVNLIHQLTTQYPQVASQTFQYPQDDLPPDTENAILDFVARHVDPRARARIAREIQTALDNYNTGGKKEVRLSPEAAEVLRAYREENDVAVQSARQRVPMQQQLEM